MKDRKYVEGFLEWIKNNKIDQNLYEVKYNLVDVNQCVITLKEKPNGFIYHRWVSHCNTYKDLCRNIEFQLKAFSH